MKVVLKTGTAVFALWIVVAIGVSVCAADWPDEGDAGKKPFKILIRPQMNGKTVLPEESDVKISCTVFYAHEGRKFYRTTTLRDIAVSDTEISGMAFLPEAFAGKKADLFVALEPRLSFPFEGKSATVEVAPDAEWPLVVELPVQKRKVEDKSRHEEVRFKIISAYSGKPVTNFRTYAGKNKVLTDDKGCFMARVDPSEKLHIRHSRPQLEPTLEEMRQQVVEPQQLRQAIEKDEPLVLLTRKPRIVGRLLSESGVENDVPEGTVRFSFAWGDRGTSFGRRLLNNTFFVFGDEGVALPEKCTGTVTNLGGNVGEAYMLKEQVKFELTAEAEPLELAIPVIKRGVSKLTIRVKNAEDDSPVANAVVMLFSQGSNANSGRTDESGVAVFPGLRMGQYRISVKADHHQQASGGSLLTRAEERV